jgi:hypothetical protein
LSVAAVAGPARVSATPGPEAPLRRARVIALAAAAPLLAACGSSAGRTVTVLETGKLVASSELSAEAGSVSVRDDGTTLTLTGVTLNPGWTQLRTVETPTRIVIVFARGPRRETITSSLVGQDHHIKQVVTER